MDITGLMNIVISLVIVALICYVLWWGVGQLGEPFSKVGTVLIALVAVIFLVGLLTGHVQTFKWIH